MATTRVGKNSHSAVSGRRFQHGTAQQFTGAHRQITS
jgi:hypothetical protein